MPSFHEDIWDLMPMLDKCKSYHGKAKVLCYHIRENNVLKVIHQELLSYDRLVANYVEYFENGNIIEVFEYFGKFNRNTTRHQKEFFRQFVLSDEDIKILFKKGRFERITE